MAGKTERDIRLARDKSTDTPIHPDTSSIGALEWPPIVASESRLKGIYPEVIADPLKVINLFTEVKQLPFQDGPDSSDVSRISARAFITREAFRAAIVSEPGLIAYLTEGAIDLEGTQRPELDDLVWVYLGRNDPRRRSNHHDFSLRIDDVAQIFSGDEVDVIERADPQYGKKGYSIDLLPANASEDTLVINQYAKLYQIFGRTREEVITMLKQPSNIHVAAFHGGDLISAGIAELGEIPLIRNGQRVPIKFAEITEAATDEVYRRQGFYTIVANHLNRQCAKLDLDFVMAESNTSSLGVIVSAKHQGRRTSLEVLKSFGLPLRLLEQHVRIFEGSADNRPTEEKNDLVPTFMTRKTLQDRYGNQK